MKLYALSDLHLGYAINREALTTMPAYPEDWLIVAGDIGETEAHLHYAFTILTHQFARVIWTPGNHDLWTMPKDRSQLRGVAKYERMVEICREYGVLTPEDPYVQWPGDGKPYVLAPLFTLYDYSFRPDHVPADQAIAWAAETNVVCTDESFLYPDPYPSREAWCWARCDYTEQRLQSLSPSTPTILINHFPLREDLVRLRYIPRFSLWCGTKRTHDWHTRFAAAVVIYGHLHIRATDWRDSVRFEEASLGYPKQWDQSRSIDSYLREILPGPSSP